MARKNLNVSENTAIRDLILNSLILLDEKGNNSQISLIMTIVHEAFSACNKGENINGFELLHRSIWSFSRQEQDTKAGNFEFDAEPKI